MRTRFTRRLTHLATVSALAFVSSCLDPTALKLSDIVGDWKLIHLNRTSASTGETIDAMQADSGSSLLMTVAADGSLTTVSVSGGGAPVNGTGSLTLSGANKLVLDGQAYYGSVFLKDGLLTVDCGEQLGIAEYSRIVFVFARP
jgi:hypothetical protein